MNESYGETVSWEPAAPRIGLLRLLVSLADPDRVGLRRRGARPRRRARPARRGLARRALARGPERGRAAGRWPRCGCRSWSRSASSAILLVDAGLLLLVDAVFPDWLRVDGFGDALLMSVVMAVVGIVLQVIVGTNDDDEYTLRVTRRIAAPARAATPRTDVPGIIFLEIDGLALPVLRRALRDGSAPTMARWIADHGYHLAEWETDLSSQTGASQAGILLGSNEDISAFRWVEKETGPMMVCSSAADCAEIERRHSTGIGLLADGGASRGNLLSGEAEEAILTVSRMDAEKRANPGYRAFLANGFNVTRLLVLYLWEVVLEWVAAARQKRRDVRPRGHRGGVYPFLRARDVRVHPRPDRLQRADRHDARAPGGVRDVRQLRRGRAPLRARARRHVRGAAQARPAVRAASSARAATRRARTRSSCSPTTARPRARRSSSATATGSTSSSSARCRTGSVAAFEGGDEQQAVVGHAVDEATGKDGKKRAKNDVSGRDVVVLGSGNLGLVYLMESNAAADAGGDRASATPT